eukprot:GHVS01015650.1.p1 GENE.GHVS01015650.1~~GHVS01015650.1.p1  ORF type:complete len:753 (+),score=195.56 GHVS01015650.1:167-2425(+)
MLSSLEVDLAVALVHDTFGHVPSVLCHTLLVKGSLALQELQTFLKDPVGGGSAGLQHVSFDSLALSLLVLIQHNLVTACVKNSPPPPPPLSVAPPPPFTPAQLQSYRLAAAGVCGQIHYEASPTALAARLRLPRYALLAEAMAGRDARALLCQVAKLGRASMKAAIQSATSEYYDNSYALLLEPTDYLRFSDGSTRRPPPSCCDDLQRCFVRLVADSFLLRCEPVLRPPPPTATATAATDRHHHQQSTVVAANTATATTATTPTEQLEEGGKVGGGVDTFGLFDSDSDSTPRHSSGKPADVVVSRGVVEDKPADVVVSRGVVEDKPADVVVSRGVVEDKVAGGMRGGVGGKRRGGGGRGKRKLTAAGEGKEEGRGGRKKVLKRTVEEMSPTPPPPQTGDDLNSLSRDLMQIIHDTTGSYSAAELLAGGAANEPAGRSKRAVEKEKMKSVMELYHNDNCVFQLNYEHLNLLLSKQMAEDFVAARFVDSPVVRFAIRCLLNKVRHQSTAVRGSNTARTVYSGRMSFPEIEHEVAEMAAAQSKRPAERNTLLKVLDAMTRHRDRIIINETEGASSMYFIDWNALKTLLKGRVIYDAVSARCGEAASRVWSVIAQPNQASGRESPLWDDKTVATTALMSPNKARESLYRLAVEGFARMQESDVTTLPNCVSTRHAAVFSIHQTEVRCHVLSVLFKTTLNLYHRKRRECAQINQLDWRLQSLNAAEEKKLLALQSGEDLLEAELLNLDRLIMILRDL